MARQLILAGLHVNYYNQKEAMAYVYSMNAFNHPIDHNGKAITSFMPHHDLVAFENFISTTIRPIIEKRLKNSEFEISGIGFYNNAPHPSLIIVKKDMAPINENDLKNIKLFLQKLIEKNNKEIAKVDRLFRNDTPRPSRKMEKQFLFR